MRHLRRSGTLTRDQIALRSRLSAATVARTVNALIEDGLLRERHDLTETTGRGRPHIPVQIDDRRFVCIGVHVGYRASTIALGSLTGAVLSATVVPHTAPRPSAAGLAAQVGALLNGSLDRVPVAAAVVAPFERIDVQPVAFASELGTHLGMQVAVGGQVGSLAGVEFMDRGYAAAEPTTYLYLRDVAGSVQMVEREGEVLTTHLLDLAHLPTSSTQACWCGRSGCLEAVASDRAVAGRAVASGLIERPYIPLLVAAAEAGSLEAVRVLTERAEVLGQAAAMLRDLIHPRHLVVFGQAFTDDPARHHVIRSAWAQTKPGITELSISSTGTDLQARGAIATALGTLFADPRAALAAMG